MPEIAATNEAGEKLATQYRAARQNGDGPEGTRESLERCARMLDTYAPDLYPANELGQVDFARAMMESVADEIRAYLAASPSRPGSMIPGDVVQYDGFAWTVRKADLVHVERTDPANGFRVNWLIEAEKLAPAVPDTGIVPAVELDRLADDGGPVIEEPATA